MDYLLHILILSAIYSFGALSVNYISGYLGLITLSQGAFMGLGAYGSAILLKDYGFSFVAAYSLALIFTGVVAYLLSFPLLRLKGDSYVLVTFGLAFIASNLFFNLSDLTNGALGIKGIPSPMDLLPHPKLVLFLLVFLMLILALVFLSRIVLSSYGIILKSIRDHLQVAKVAGHDVDSYRRSVFVISALLAGIAGIFLSSFISAIDPLLFNYHLSILLLIMAITGGLASLKGSLIGAFLLIIIPELLRFVGFPSNIIAESQQMVYGIILILFMMWRPKGLLGQYSL